VVTESMDHNSQIKFIEEWQKAKGRNVTATLMNPWRRQHMSNMLIAFDFEHPDYSIPNIPDVPVPHKRPKTGLFDPTEFCQSQFPVTRPPVPYGLQEMSADFVAARVEKGFNQVRGFLTEGRYLAFESARPTKYAQLG
jgi:phospholipase C